MDQCRLGLRDNSCNQVSQFRGAQTFTSNPDNGRFGTAGYGDDRMKIGIQSDDNPTIRDGPLNDLDVTGRAHTDFADVQYRPTTSPEDFGSFARQALIQQQRYQAASRRTTSSSRY